MAKIEKTAAGIEKTALLDKKMNQVFDWAKDNDKPIRIMIWNHFMEKDDHQTMKAADDVKWELTASDDDIKKFCEENFK